MQLTPSRQECFQQWSEGKPLLIATELVADLETPVSAMIKLGLEDSHSCLLESVEGGNVRGRFSVLALKPDLVWRCQNGKAEIEWLGDGRIEEQSTPPLQSLRQLVAMSKLEIPEGLPPMAAGIFGYFGYDMIREVETIPDSTSDALGVPDAQLMRPSVVVIFDRLKDSMLLCSPVWRKHGDDDLAETALQQAEARFEAVITLLNQPVAKQGRSGDAGSLPEVSSNMEKQQFLDMVGKAVSYIRAGDIFQVVLSQRFSVPFPLPAFSLYRALRRLNPSPFLIFFKMGDFSIAGSSPEILVRLRDGKVTIRPVAGTRPRGADTAEDESFAEDLLADVKERAEHLMLLDLGRNDTGRVSQPGSVRVVESFKIERYSHVMHIASEVEGRIRPELDAIDALIAGFPAGTVSGAPKIRAMEIIDDLEQHRRGPYAGAAGYISASGDLDSCITLRTAIVKDDTMHIQAGAGIVYDSVPEMEFQETVNKAMALIRAAAEAMNQHGE